MKQSTASVGFGLHWAFGITALVWPLAFVTVT